MNQPTPQGQVADSEMARLTTGIDRVLPEGEDVAGRNRYRQRSVRIVLIR